MCMKNVNATILFCSKVDKDENNIYTLTGLYDSIVPVMKDNMCYVDNFNLMLSCNVIFDSKTENNPECLQKEKKYECATWLTHVQSGMGIELDTVDLIAEDKNIKSWCREFYEMKRFVTIPRLVFPKGLGNYAVKVFIREKDEGAENPDTPWRLQTIHSLIIGDNL